jgi:hypothetical protein
LYTPEIIAGRQIRENCKPLQFCVSHFVEKELSCAGHGMRIDYIPPSWGGAHAHVVGERTISDPLR